MAVNKISSLHYVLATAHRFVDFPSSTKPSSCANPPNRGEDWNALAVSIYHAFYVWDSFLYKADGPWNHIKTTKTPTCSRFLSVIHAFSNYSPERVTGISERRQSINGVHSSRACGTLTSIVSLEDYYQRIALVSISQRVAEGIREKLCAQLLGIRKQETLIILVTGANVSRKCET